MSVSPMAPADSSGSNCRSITEAASQQCAIFWCEAVNPRGPDHPVWFRVTPPRCRWIEVQLARGVRGCRAPSER